MITTLAVSFQHLFLVLIILGLVVGLPLYLILKVQKSNKKEKQLLSNSGINSIGTEEPTPMKIDEDISRKLEKYGKMSEKTNLILYIVTLLFLAVYITLHTISKNPNIDFSDNTSKIGVIIGGIITFIFYVSIFTLMFNPITKLYQRYLIYSQGSIDKQTFYKLKNRAKTRTIILSVICIPLSLGVFGLLMIPHYIFSSTLNKIRI